MALYAAHGNGAGLKTLLGFGETRYNARKLYAALKELQQSQALADQQEEVIEAEKTAIAKATAHKRDPVLTKLYQERHILHAELRYQTTDNDRKRVAYRILTNTEQTVTG